MKYLNMLWEWCERYGNWLWFAVCVAFVGGCIYDEAQRTPESQRAAYQRDAQKEMVNTVEVCVNGIQYYYVPGRGLGGAVINQETKTYVECK